jgi:hypothetical protein
VIAKRFLLPFLLLLLMIGGASAQLAGEKVRQPWLMLSKLTSPISVTTSSAATQLPSMGLELWACNTGTFDAYLGFGTANTVSVTVATGSWLRAGGCVAYDLYPPGLVAPYTYVAAIGSGGSTTIYLEAGIGQPPLETSVVASGTISATQGTSPWVVSSYASGNTQSITRPANTTQYTADTGWCSATSTCTGVFTFTSVCRAASQRANVQRISAWSSANQSTKLQAVLWLFSATPGTVISDDATFTIASSDYANLTGAKQGFAFTMVNNQASGAANAGADLYPSAQITCDSSNQVYGMVEVVNTYTPVSGEVLSIAIDTIGLN